MTTDQIIVTSGINLATMYDLKLLKIVAIWYINNCWLIKFGTLNDMIVLKNDFKIKNIYIQWLSWSDGYVVIY